MASPNTRSALVRLALGAGFSAIALGLAMPAYAQDKKTAANKEDQNPTIVVTAQFRQQNLQDTPLAITAVNAAVMEAKSQTNLSDVADSAPNVTLRPAGTSFGPSITASIRGVGQNDFSPAFEPGVGIYIDDVYYPQLTGALFDLLDLDRIEILRGPQGTLSGRNSEGGSIKMFSKKPNGEDGGYVEATYGARHRMGLRASADFTLANNLFARVSGVFKKEDGYVDQLDYGCVYPAGGTATYTDNNGTTQLRNPAGGIAAIQPAGQCRLSKLGEINYQALRAMVRYNPTSDFDLVLSADYTHDKHTIPGEVLLATSPIDTPNTNVNGVIYDNKFICGPYCNFATTHQPAIDFTGLFAPGNGGPPGQPLAATNGNNQQRYEGYNLSANLHWGLNDMLSIDNILAYQHWNADFDTDDDLSPIPLNLGQNHLSHWSWSEELRLNAKITDAASVVLGGFYFKQNTRYFSYQDIRYVSVFPLQFIQPDYTPAESKAAFANLNWEIVQGLTLNAGVRYTEESKEYHYFRLNPDGTVNPYLDPIGYWYGAGYSGPDTLDKYPGFVYSPFFIPVGDGNTTQIVSALTGSVARYKGHRWDYRVALDYRFSPEVMVYGSVATGFKGGGTNPRPFNAGQVISFDPEVLTSWEAGIKTDLFDRRLRFNLTGFYGILRGAQLPVLACPDSPCAARLNAGNAHEKGFEAELSARPIEGLDVDASLSYLDFHFTELNATAMYPSNPAGAALSDPPGGVPKWKATAGVQYEIPLGESFGSITPRFDVNYQGKIYTGYPVVIGTTRTLAYIPGYTLVNARLTWQNPDKNLSVALEVTNLTDKYFLLNNFDLRGAGAGFDKGQPGRPREWALTVKKKF